MQTTDLHSK